MSQSSASMSVASTRLTTFQQEYDATIAAFRRPQFSSTIRSIKQQPAHGTVPTSLNQGSLRTRHRVLSADYDSVANRTSIKETCADMNRATVVSSFFGSVSKGKRDRDQNVVQTLRDRQHLQKILERKI